MIVFSDVHLREDSADVVLGEVLPGIYQAAIELQDYKVACLGDLFHLRYKVDARIQNALKDEFQKWVSAGIELRILPGNHDQYEVSGRNVLELFGHIPGVRVYSEPVWDAYGLWVPYRKDPAEILKALTLLGPTDGPFTLWLHHGIRGAWMNDCQADSEGLPLESLGTKWSTILCGHYHRHQKVGSNLWYIGSPWQTNANEAGQIKGFCQWTPAGLVFHERRWGPRIHVFELQAGQQLDLTGVRPRDEVRIKTVGVGAEQAAVFAGSMLAKAGIARHTVTPELQKMQARLSVSDGSSLRQYAEAYVGQIQTELDKARLMQIFGELTVGVIR